MLLKENVSIFFSKWYFIHFINYMTPARYLARFTARLSAAIVPLPASALGQGTSLDFA